MVKEDTDPRKPDPEDADTWPAAVERDRLVDGAFRHRVNEQLARDATAGDFRSSPELAKLATALCKAQSEMTHAVRNEENPFFKANYADLASVMDVARGPLTKNGIALIQGAFTNEARITVRTRLIHVSGEWIESATGATAKDVDPQAVGSVITYLRRYSLSSMLGIATEDDDGEAGQGRKQNRDGKPAAQQQKKGKGDPTLTKKQVKDISAGFQQYQVGIGRLEERLGMACDKWTEKQRVELILLYKQLEAGKNPDEVFPAPEPGSKG